MIWTKACRDEYAKQMRFSETQRLELDNRRCGYSTGLAFEIFSECYKKPNNWIQIKDHHGTEAADRHLFSTMRNIAFALGFEFEWKASPESKYYVKFVRE